MGPSVLCKAVQKACFVTFMIWRRIPCYCQGYGNVLLLVHLQSQDKTQALKCDVGKVKCVSWVHGWWCKSALSKYCARVTGAVPYNITEAVSLSFHKNSWVNRLTNTKYTPVLGIEFLSTAPGINKRELENLRRPLLWHSLTIPYVIEKPLYW